MRESIFDNLRRSDEEQIEMFPTAARARDAGLQQVRENSGDWFPQALAMFDRIRGLYRGQIMTGEEIRALIEISPVGPPPNHVNAYGSLIRVMAQRKWVKDTGDRCKALTLKSHAREIRLWRIM